VPAAHLADVDAIFISHGHFDHLDLPSLRAIPGRPQVIVPAGLGHVLQRADLGPVHEVRVGDRLHVAGVELEIVPAAHGGRRSPWAAADAIGCLISAGSTVYFAGDTDLFPAMETMAGELTWPCCRSGVGPRLGRGHLDPRRAAEAAALIEPTIAVPIHWGTLSPVWLHRLFGRQFDAPGPAFAQAAARYARPSAFACWPRETRSTCLTAVSRPRRGSGAGRADPATRSHNAEARQDGPVAALALIVTTLLG